LNCVEIPRTTRSFSDAMKTLDAMIASGRFLHGGDPVLVWALGNVVAKEDAGGNVFPRKEQDAQKIDPAVALLMALSRALTVETNATSAGGFAFL
jgi:phage terminase large subunit-like protein